MNRRRVLETAFVGAASLLGVSRSATATSVCDSDALGVARRRTYDELAVGSVAPAHGGGYVLVNRGDSHPSPEVPVRVAVVDERGTVRQRREIALDVPEDARRANADVIRTEGGYAVATGSWFARLDADLSLEATGFASGYEPNGTTRLVELADGFTVAAELDRPNHVSVRVLGFDGDGEFRWSRSYGEENSKWLDFLLPDSDGGVVVGGRKPWLAGVAPDGTERWQTTVADAPPEVGYDATRDDEEFVLFGGSNALGLTESRSVEWRRSYDSLANASGGVLARTTDGGYLLAGLVALDRIGVVAADAEGRPCWSHEYEVVGDGAAYLADVVERAPGESLVVGSRRKGQNGWSMALSGAGTPTARTSTASSATTERRTASTDASETRATSTEATETQTSSTVPGFGVGAALLGTAGGLLARGATPSDGDDR
ncbi:hypothetical protein [Halorussus caseinilyticus]|uniref:PGF-CTERM sorting domain-containing protein n=1 Tax=Halorussus caseinilyticus TaxID=3034025 RepID=A0ABD5WPQ1_9EURY|nr:hypothetical protein [Halorussus sp. DT72]